MGKMRSGRVVGELVRADIASNATPRHEVTGAMEVQLGRCLDRRRHTRNDGLRLYAFDQLGLTESVFYTAQPLKPKVQTNIRYGYGTGQNRAIGRLASSHNPRHLSLANAFTKLNTQQIDKATLTKTNACPGGSDNMPKVASNPSSSTNPMSPMR